MKIQSSIYPSLALLAILTMGCSHTEEGDTSPLPSQDPKARVEQATKTIESSTMTPEQKRAALDYLKRGAQGAEKIKESAKGAGTGAPK
jgi:hypothetical protein